MLSRFIPKPSLFYRVLTLTRSPTHLVNSKPIFRNPTFSSPNHYFFPRNPQFCFFSSKGENGNGNDDSATSTTDLWNISSEIDEGVDSLFSEETRDRSGSPVKNDYGEIGDPFGGIESDFGRGDIFSGFEGSGGVGGVDDEEGAHEEIKPWSLTEEKEGAEEDIFGGEADGKEIDFGNGLGEGVEKSEEDIQLELEEKALTDVLKGPNRAFGDLIASSGITDEMLDSLIALKDFEGIQGLPPLSEIEEKRYMKNARRSGRGDTERQKLEEAAKVRVRKVDEKGRAYGTGRRKCSIARVWIQPGGGKFYVNDKEFDVYFPMLDHRATLLRPFSETKTLGMWDVHCTVKGGGTSGQVGAILLGISRALQSWEPGFRPPLKQAGFLTRDPRVVERKKPGKAKARKSFQWVKR